MNRDTICVQGGYTPGNGEPRQIPIIQSTTFKYATSEDMGKLFDLEANGYFYSRLQNPTCDLVAKKICELEGGTAAMLTSSGQAANFFALFNLCQAGDHIVASSTIYGGTFNLISVTMKKMGIEATFVDPLCTEEELNAAFRPNTKVVFGETIANPALTVLDIEKFAQAAHAHGVPLIVDNTFPTPVNCRPFEWGADIVTHSTTKYMDGHGAVLGGAIVDSGKFDWTAYPDKFPGLCTPDDSYHGVTYTQRFGLGGAERGVLIGRAPGEHRKAHAAAVTHPVLQADETDLAGEAHMRRAARAPVNAWHLHDAHRHRERLFLPERHRRKLFLRWPEDVYRKVFPHVLVCKTLEPQKLLRVNLAVKVDRRAVLVHVEADVLAAPKRMRMAGHQVLGRVDLHTGKARFPVDGAVVGLARLQRLVYIMFDFPVFLVRVKNANAADHSAVAELAAALGEKRRAVERDLKSVFVLFARGNRCREGFHVAVDII